MNIFTIYFCVMKKGLMPANNEGITRYRELQIWDNGSKICKCEKNMGQNGNTFVFCSKVWNGNL